MKPTFLVLTLMSSLFTVQAFANDCESLNDDSLRASCVLESNKEVIRSFSLGAPSTDLMEKWRGCEYPKSPVIERCENSYNTCLTFYVWPGRVESYSELYQNVEVGGFKMKFLPSRIKCD